jgi:hypothetical protein
VARAPKKTHADTRGGDCETGTDYFLRIFSNAARFFPGKSRSAARAKAT